MDSTETVLNELCYCYYSGAMGAGRVNGGVDKMEEDTISRMDEL